MVNIKPRTLIPVTDVLNNVQEHVSHKYDIPIADINIDNEEYTIYLGKQSARHKKCYLSLESKDGELHTKFQSEYANNCDLPNLFNSLVAIAAANAGVIV